MKIALGSMFRDSTGYLDRYFGQVGHLRSVLESHGHSLKLFLAEGDSEDRTWDRLQVYLSDGGWDHALLKREHGSKHPWHWSDVPERWKAISWVCNGIIECVQGDHAVDAFIYVESDLGWDSQTMIKLLSHLADVPSVAPMAFAGDNFYDLWGHIGMDGKHFGPFPPYHPSLVPGQLTEIYSAGSCILMRGDVVRSGVRWDSIDHCRGLGRSIREAGYSLWIDPDSRVVHY